MHNRVGEFGRTLERLDLRRQGFQVIRYLAMTALVFQLVHFVEHIAQLSYWFLRPASPPWLTPWAETGRDLLVIDGTHGSGNELLHLLGNLIFMAGVGALALLIRSDGRTVDSIRHLRPALLVQGFHVIEHLALTATYLLFGSAIGFSTLFGASQGEFGIGLRVWAHFILNLVASYYAFRAGAQLLWAGPRRAALHRRRTAQTRIER